MNVSPEDELKDMNFDSFSDEELVKLANKIMDNLMDASTNKDYEAHTKDFSKRIMKFFSKEYFEEVVKKYQEEKGYFLSRSFVKLFRREDSIAVVWKQTFTKAKGDYIAELVLKYENGKIVCDHAWVI